MPHVDHIFDTVINVPLARFQCGGVRIADDCLKEARLTLINHEVSRGPLLAPENLALEHPVSIAHYGRCTCWRRGRDEALTAGSPSSYGRGADW
jgi:hypothetical protein